MKNSEKCIRKDIYEMSDSFERFELFTKAKNLRCGKCSGVNENCPGYAYYIYPSMKAETVDSELVGAVK